RRRRQVPGAREVRAAVVDGVEGRDRAGAGRDRERCRIRRQGGEGMSTTELAPVDDVTEALRDVVDPELGINVVDLGLVYGLTVDDANIAVVDMTLTSAACPLQDVIEDQMRMALDGLVADFRVNWVWMPPWGPDKITDDGREQLRALGFNV